VEPLTNKAVCVCVCVCVCVYEKRVPNDPRFVITTLATLIVGLYLHPVEMLQLPILLAKYFAGLLQLPGHTQKGPQARTNKRVSGRRKPTSSAGK
jgi:hypothetical protein